MVRSFIQDFSGSNEERRRIQYRKLLEQLPPRERVLLLTDYGYKFSKTSEELSECFAEGWYKQYVPGTLAIDSEIGISFMIDTKILLKAAIYGDQLTRFSFWETDKYFPAIQDANMVYENGMFDAYRSNTLSVDYNFPMSCPYTIKALIKHCGSLCAFMTLFSPNGALKYKTLLSTYGELGFQDSADFLRDVEGVFRKTYSYQYVQQEVDHLLPGDIQI